MNNTEEDVISIIQQGHNMVVLGGPGTGKTHLIRTIVKSVKKNICLAGSTGMAAINMGPGAVTVNALAGLLDGRYTRYYLERHAPTDEAFEETRKRLKDCELLIIDEASMISARIFEQLEAVCRCIRMEQKVFGDLQLLFVMDPQQLPPVPDRKCGDTGKYCFQSHLWQAMFPHHVTLSANHRTSGQHLQELIKESFEGELSDSASKTAQKLSRPLDATLQQKATHLFGTNFECAHHNSMVLKTIAGTATLFKAKDEGNVPDTFENKAPKKLFLKKGCRVIVTRNIRSLHLVNGQRGQVVKVFSAPDKVEITVDGQDRQVALVREDFRCHDSTTGKVSGCRTQIPLKLAYGTTVHKSQGLTLPAVVVHCQNMAKPGMMGVALSRVRSEDHLQIVDFKKEICKAPIDEVKEFMMADSDEVKSNPDECCRKVDFQELGTEKWYDVTDSEEEEDKTAAAISDDEGPSTSGMATRNFHITEEHITNPPSADEVRDIITELTNTFPDTKGVTSLKTENICQFIHTFRNSFASWIKGNNHCSVKTAQQTKLFGDLFKLQTTDEFKQMVAHLFNISLRDLTAHHLRVGFMLSRNVVRAALDSNEEDIEETQSSVGNRMEDELKKHGAAAAKLRYIGGFVIAKLRHKNRKALSSKVHNPEGIECRKRMAANKIFDKMSGSADATADESKFPLTFADIDSRKYGNLSYLTDEVYQFFHTIEVARIQQLTMAGLAKYGDDLPGKVVHDILADRNIANCFEEIVASVDISSVFKEPKLNDRDGSKKATARYVSSIVSGLCTKAEVMCKVKCDVVTLFLRTAAKSFQQDVIHEFKIKRQDALRIKITKGKGKTTAKRSKDESESKAKAKKVKRKQPKQSNVCLESNSEDTD